MPRYKTETRPGLVALYNIQPGIGVGQFLQPWSLQGPLTQCLVPVATSWVMDNDGICNISVM